MSSINKLTVYQMATFSYFEIHMLNIARSTVHNLQESTSATCGSCL